MLPKKKPVYKDPPRFPVINVYEQVLKDRYQKSVGTIFSQLSKKLATFVKN